MNVNDVVSGVVTSIKPYGFFVKINDQVTCLVHISEIADEFIENIEDFVAVDQKVDVKIISINDDKYAATLKF